MKRSTTCLLFAVIAGCRGVKSNPGTPDGTPPDDAPHDSPAPETHPLGMNDISLLMPGLNRTPDIGTMSELERPDGSRVALVPQVLFTRLVTAHHDLNYDYADFEIFTIRFDLCDRVIPGPCPEGADGSLRLVFQPFKRAVDLDDDIADVGVQAFYAIPPVELAAAINQLRIIARLSEMPTASTLRVHTSGPPARDAIRALLARHALPGRLIRLAVMGHDESNPDPRVVFRALELRDGEMVDLPVATIGALQQDAVLADADPSYVVTPVADSPQGLALTLSSAAFSAAAPEDQRAALDALVAAQNPRLHTSATVQCIGCHVSTYLAVHRGQVAGVDIFSLPSRFTSERDLGVGHGVAESDPHALLGFGWMRSFASEVSISQRVSNETAMVLDEIEARFPVPARDAIEARAAVRGSD